MKKLLIPLLLFSVLAWVDLAHAGSKTFHNAATANATGSNISVEDKGILGMTVSISGTATVTVQGSADGGVTWTNMSCQPFAGGAGSATITASGQFLCNTAGLSHVQAPLTGCSACTVTVKVITSTAGGGIGIAVNSSGQLVLALISGEDTTNNLIMTSGGAVRNTALMTGVTGNVTGSTYQLPVGSKSIQANLLCNNGSSTNCGITVTIYGAVSNTQTTGTFEQLCQLIIPTGAARTTYTCNPITGNFLYMWATTTGVAGTSPSLDVTAMF